MKNYWLVRDVDVNGISGTGIVAEVVEFTSGKCAVAWLTEIRSVALYDSLTDLMKIHGHGGKTRLVTSTTENTWHLEQIDQTDGVLLLTCGWKQGTRMPQFPFPDPDPMENTGAYRQLRRLCDFLNGNNPHDKEYLGDFEKYPGDERKWRAAMEIKP